MIFPGTSYSTAITLIGTRPGLHLQRSLSLESLHILLADTRFSVTRTLNTSLILPPRPFIFSAKSLAHGFTSARTFRSGVVNMGDSLRTDGLPTLNTVGATSASLANYSFPESRLRILSDPKKIPVILMACGSLSVAEPYSKLGIPD